MAYIFAVGFLVISALIAGFALVFVLNLGGLPGALIAGRMRSDVNLRWLLGFVMALLGQSYLALAYVAFVVSWTQRAIAHQHLSPFVLWSIAFLAVIIPLIRTYSAARTEAMEDGYVELRHAQLDALGWTTFIGVAGFLVFAFFPSLVRAIYPWMPYLMW